MFNFKSIVGEIYKLNYKYINYISLPALKCMPTQQLEDCFFKNHHDESYLIHFYDLKAIIIIHD